jgi:hypothetical protein
MFNRKVANQLIISNVSKAFMFVYNNLTGFTARSIFYAVFVLLFYILAGSALTEAVNFAISFIVEYRFLII